MNDCLAMIVKVAPGRCGYCRREVEEALTLRFPEGRTGVYCQRDAMKHVLERAQAEESDDSAELTFNNNDHRD
jgi:hypothetical protein